MKHYTLQRLEQTEAATFGILVDDEQNEIAKTVERPWVDANHDGVSDKSVSCIPPGTYEAFRRAAATTRHGYDVFELERVPGRSNIQIHIANVASELEGCIALGSHFDTVHGERGVVESRTTYAAWMKRNEGIDRITLTVVGP